jgi:hypothetical protein
MFAARIAAFVIAGRSRSFPESRRRDCFAALLFAMTMDKKAVRR